MAILLIATYYACLLMRVETELDSTRAAREQRVSRMVRRLGASIGIATVDGDRR